jgi:hypothetical protein
MRNRRFGGIVHASRYPACRRGPAVRRFRIAWPPQAFAGVPGHPLPGSRSETGGRLAVQRPALLRLQAAFCGRSSRSLVRPSHNALGGQWARLRCSHHTGSGREPSGGRRRASARNRPAHSTLRRVGMFTAQCVAGKTSSALHYQGASQMCVHPSALACHPSEGSCG